MHIITVYGGFFEFIFLLESKNHVITVLGTKPGFSPQRVMVPTHYYASKETPPGDELIVCIEDIEAGFPKHFTIGYKIAGGVKKIETVFGDKSSGRKKLAIRVEHTQGGIVDDATGRNVFSVLIKNGDSIMFFGCCSGACISFSVGTHKVINV
tara:strand:+ start:210 stop:668 length:459 start_codon:yes stop_codon:yes gene_type:complete